MIELVDTHAHLGMLTHSPLDEILSRAHSAGVSKMITVSTNRASWERNREIATNHPNLYYSLGVHPHDAVEWEADRPSIVEEMKRATDRCVAVGEMGLDFHYNLSPSTQQVLAFEDQLLIAKERDLPVIVHCRDAFGALFTSIEKVGLGRRAGVMHCFTGTSEEAKRSVDLGFKISFSGILTFKNAGALRETAKEIPADALLVETDCPFLAPMPNRGKPNEPSYLPLTAAVLAELRGVKLEEIALITSKNAIEFFRL